MLDLLVENLEKAYKKLKISEVTSDLQSEAETEKLQRRKSSKRKVYSSEENEDDDPFPRPPTIKKALKGFYLYSYSYVLYPDLFLFVSEKIPKEKNLPDKYKLSNTIVKNSELFF